MLTANRHLTDFRLSITKIVNIENVTAIRHLTDIRLSDKLFK